MTKKDLNIKKPNQTIMITNGEITATQRKAYNVLMHKAQQDLSVNENQRTFLISIADIEEKAGIQDTNNKRLRENLKALMKTVISCVHERGEWVEFVLLSQLRKNGDLLQFEFPSVIVESILKGDYYTTLDLMILKTLKGKYAIIFYELAMRYHKVEIPRLDIDEFKALTGTEGYRDFKEIRKWCIEPGLEEVNRESDIIMGYEAFKTGRKVTAIKFSVKKKTQIVLGPVPTSEKSPSSEQSPPPQQKIDQSFVTFPGTDPELVRQTIAEIGVEAVTEIHADFLKQLKRSQAAKGKKIDAPDKYYANHLRKRIGVKTPKQRQDEKDRQTLIEKRRQEKAQKENQAVIESQQTRNEAERLEKLVAALSEPDRERLRAAAILKMPPSMIKIKASVKNRMESLVEEFMAGKFN